jgi:hypothetical protein
MSGNPPRSAIDDLKGWNVCGSLGQAVKTAHLKRHPKHDSYVSINERKSLTQAEQEAYGRLNHNLHEALRRVSREHFDGVPVPDWIEEEQGAESVFTPFTSQNYDWYSPSYECYILVLADYMSAELLRKFQALLQGEYADWCIQVVGSDDLRFDNDHEIAIFSDEVLVRDTDPLAMTLPKGHQPPQE